MKPALPTNTVTQRSPIWYCGRPRHRWAGFCAFWRLEACNSRRFQPVVQRGAFCSVAYGGRVTRATVGWYGPQLGADLPCAIWHKAVPECWPRIFYEYRRTRF